MKESGNLARDKRSRGRPRAGVRSPGKPHTKAAQGPPREEILKVAASLFSGKGYAGTTMADIADMVGVRSPSLYYHFSDKSDVLRAIADVIMDDALSDSHKLVRSKSDTTTKRLHDLVGGIVYRLRTSPYELNCMFDPVFLTEEFRDVSKKIHSWAVDLESLIRQGVSEGCFAPQNSKMAMHTVRGLVQSAIRHPGGIPKLSPKEIADYFATFAVKGLLADTRR